MRCIFCKQNTDKSKSEEHIIPASLGNLEHILPKGIVCDKCNNYFSRKIEKPLLESFYFLHARAINKIVTKRGKYPPNDAIHIDSGINVKLIGEKDGWSISASTEQEEERFIKKILTSSKGTIIVPNPMQPSENDKYVLSRFLGKIAIEVLAQRLIHIKGGLDEVIDKPELDMLRNYTRRGNQNLIWPYSERRIYPEEKWFSSDNGQNYQILHEYNLLYTPDKETYLVIAIFGIEYAINLAGPTIDGYMKWIDSNENISFLD
ncbi:MAG: HNH endonuclease [Candidatus Cloacimonetes bacterium]|nr:HNH endonuclease [Candidatus Cloacimonadota bacterium]